MDGPTSSSRSRVLIVEDSPPVARRLAEMLGEMEGVEIVGPVADGVEAWELFRRVAPQVVVLDLKLPHWDGLELLRAIRDRDLSSLVIVLSLHDRDEYRRRCMQFGADYFLSKSRDFELVRTVIEQFLRERP